MAPYHGNGATTVSLLLTLSVCHGEQLRVHPFRRSTVLREMAARPLELGSGFIDNGLKEVHANHFVPTITVWG